MPPDLPRLRATLGQPALTRLLDALARRLARGRPLTGKLTLASCTAAERLAADQLLGRKPTQGDSLQIDLDLLAETLADAAICTTLHQALETLRGPAVDRRAQSEAAATAWAKSRSSATTQFSPWPALLPWLDDLFSTGVLKRLAASSPARAATLLDDLARIAAALPPPAEPLAAFAARLFGDAHALDPGSPRATLAVRAASLLGGVAFEDDAEGRRTAWASVGVLCDELSTPVLVLNLPLHSATPLARLVRSACTDAEPLHLSLRLLLLHPLSADPALAGLDIFVCENPTIVALAARRLGARCAPLVCVNGQFATPAKILLRQLAAAGACLCYHGDFDVGGLAIARRVIGEHGASPWRMSAADYLVAPKGKPIAPDAPLASPWDPALAHALRHERRAVHEEAVADILLQDLASPPPSRHLKTAS